MDTYAFYEGEILLLDKPLHWTSFQAVNKLKYLCKHHPSWEINGQKVRPRLGHAGTLDPLASGLLIICTGKKTKEISRYQDAIKEYTGTLVLGATTPCGDLEKEPDMFYPWDHIRKESLEEIRPQFTGDIMQQPPLFSALKVEGKRAYDLARDGQTQELAARKITIYNLEFTRIELPEVDFKVSCSKGTYIRSLAMDIGKALNSGAYLKALRRTKIGDFSVQDAQSMDEFIHAFSKKPE